MRPGRTCCALVAAAGVLATLVAAAPAQAARPDPAGPTPSHLAVMICAKEAQHDMAEALGVTARVSRPVWVRSQHVYACRYGYPSGGFVLSLKELSSWSQTIGYFRRAGRAFGGQTTVIPNLGQGAYSTADGNVLVRKDWKVLLVDVHGLPAKFGRPPTSAGDVAVTVADVILACWAGD